MYTYKTVETALALMLGISAEARGSLRGRLKHFNRLGLVPSSPGKGQKITYKFEDAALWAFCLNLEEFGIDPTVVKIIADKAWVKVKSVICSTQPNGDSLYGKNDQFFLVDPNILSRRPWSDDFAFYIIHGNQFAKDMIGVRRTLIINITYIKRTLDITLKDALKNTY